MRAGLVTLNLVSQAGFYEKLEGKTNALLQGLQDQADNAGIAFTTNNVGGMFGLFFSEEEKITRFSQVMDCNQAHFKTFFHGMLAQGIYLAPSPYEAGFMSGAHDTEEIEQTIDAAASLFRRLA